jgi:hypothetical protein
MPRGNEANLFEKTILDEYLPQIFPDPNVSDVIKKTIMDFAGKKAVLKNDEIERAQTNPLGYLTWKLRSLGGVGEGEYIKASDTITELEGPQKNLLQEIMSLAFSIYQNEPLEEFLTLTRNIQRMGRLLPPPLPKRISPHRILSKSTEDLVIRSEGLGPGPGVQPPSPGPAPPPLRKIPVLSLKKMSDLIAQDIKRIKNKQTLSRKIIEIIKEELNNMKGMSHMKRFFAIHKFDVRSIKDAYIKLINSVLPNSPGNNLWEDFGKDQAKKMIFKRYIIPLSWSGGGRRRTRRRSHGRKRKYTKKHRKKHTKKHRKKHTKKHRKKHTKKHRKRRVTQRSIKHTKGR